MSDSAKRIKGVADLEKIRNAMKPVLAMRTLCTAATLNDAEEAEAASAGRFDLALCMGTSCISSGAVAVESALREGIEANGLQERVTIVRTGCNGFCAAGPILVVYPGGYLYHKVCAEDVAEIIQEHLLNGRLVERLMYRHPVTDAPIPFYKDLPFFALQKLRVLRNKGIIDAEKIEEYIGRDGYFALAKALEMKQDDIVAEVKKSGLRGRGGAGFSTGLKWQFCRAAPGDRKFILCNADEGDPGAFMDRSLLESDPHAVLEGMMIGARAIGAHEGFIYCRAEYPLALHRLECAIQSCHEFGLLGEHILGTDFSFTLHISRGSGAFVCGEETALMRSIEGCRGEPRPRPPFPAIKGLWDKPSVLNNVETFGNIPMIIRDGAEVFRSVGTERSPGTKIFALTGKLKNTGLVEVPVGIQLGELIYDIGGGMIGGKAFKAAQIGGPSGGCIPRQHLNVPLDYESLNDLGAIMGSGGLVVMDEETCMVDVARFFLEFVQEESCGKCVPCRVGTKRLLEILTRICNGDGEEGDIERLVELSEKIKETALCGLGKTAPNPVLSTIRHFRHEYVAHIRDKHCPAGVCPNLVRAPCQSACPAGVDVPGFVALVGEKRYAEALRLHRERNPFAAACARVCFHYCEDHCRRATLDSPVSIRGVKRFMVDQEVTVQVPETRENAENAKRKITIIGAGPSGLSCAYFLARMGYKPVVFEGEQRPGGMMTQAIPAYRLPREILAREVRMMERIGVQIETGKRLGWDIHLQELRDSGCQALYFAVGAPDCTKLGIPGEDLEGVTGALEFLRLYNTRGSVPVGRNVVICGGGNAAVDAARTAVRLGAKSVTIIYRRTREEMPAYAEEIEEAENEGVQLQMLTAPVEMAGKNGKLTGIRCKRMKLGDYDRSGRRRPEASNEEEVLIPCDQVIAAVGQQLQAKGLLDGLPMEFSEKGFVRVDPVTQRTSVDWIFAGGDAVRGPASVIEAVADGERAAIGIDWMLTGEKHDFWREQKPVEVEFDPDADPADTPRQKLPLIALERRRNNFDEVEQPWDEATAVRQAARCLRCDYGKQPCAR